MLSMLGLKHADELFRTIPSDVQLGCDLKITDPLAEPEVIAAMEEMAARNTAATKPSFLGAGVYSHFSPTIVDHLIQRSEFFTSYTPYQPEISQGTLQYIFEFQTLICQLTGMEVANASMYDGSTAMAEAYLMAQRVTRRDKIVVAKSVHPEYRDVAVTYAQHGDTEIIEIGYDEATGRVAGLEALDDKTAALVVQSPNFFGSVEDLKSLADAAHAVGALLVVTVTEAISFGLLKTPGECGADIVVGEGQSFGIPMSFGGPHLGLFATREKYVRSMPGRLCGVAYDKDGNRGFVLTLSTREQHIRREKATSNICTNSGLCALAFSIHMSLLGETGLRQVAALNHQRARELKAALEGVKGVEVLTPRFFNEFAVKLAKPAAQVVQALADRGVLGGVPYSRLAPAAGLDDVLLVAATETVTGEDIAAFQAALTEVMA